MNPALKSAGINAMWIWKLLALAGVAFGVAGIGWGYAQQPAPGFYELRIYTAQPGKRDALAKRFATRTAAIYARHGITNVGYWIPQQSDPELGISAENTFIYIRGYPSKAERDKRLTAAHDDPEFAEVVTKQESDLATKLIIKAHNIDMAPNGTYSAIAITK
jgi:NIPSNAP protein